MGRLKYLDSLVVKYYPFAVARVKQLPTDPIIAQRTSTGSNTMASKCILGVGAYLVSSGHPPSRKESVY